MASKRRRVGGTAAKKSTAASASAQGDSQSVKSQRNVRGRRGGLRDLPKMPLDILYEVFTNLQPLDLLHLARTSKDFRALLMSRSSVLLWKSARRNMVDMPDCPPYLSEPAYANLMFDAHCHGCLKATIHAKIEWKFSVRYCKSCKYDQIVPPSRSMDTPISRVVCEYRRNETYHKPDEEKAQKIYKSLKSAQEREDYVIAQKALWKAVDEHSDLCDLWLYRWNLFRSEEVINTKQGRLDAIVTKLRDLGWEKELNVLERSNYALLQSLSCVCLAKPLTDRSWSVIKKPIIELLETNKADLLFKARVDLLSSRFTSLWAARRQLSQEVHADVIPVPRDFALLPEVRAIVDAPDEVVVDETSFEVLQGSISSIIERWLSKKKTFVQKLIEHEIPEDQLRSQPDTAKPLAFDLAISLGLSCSVCKTKLTFPGVMFHCCYEPQTGVSEYETALVESTGDRMGYRGPFDFDYLRMDMEGITSIIVACGQDPSRVTLSQMDELDTRLTCGDCHKKGELEIMTWRAALRHGCRLQKLPTWVIVSDEDAVNAKDLEEKAVAAVKRLTMLAPSLYECWSCGHCRGYAETKELMQTHIHRWHGFHDKELTKADVRYDPERKGVPQPVSLIFKTRVDKGRYHYSVKHTIECGQAKEYDYTTKVPSDSD